VADVGRARQDDDMNIARVRSDRLRSHRLSSPAATVVDAATHMTATQGQEFWGGRWALAVRTKGEPTLGDVDAAFESGALVRSWTQRGTLHILPASDLDWMLRVTSARQAKIYAPVHRGLGIETNHLAGAERVVRAALAGGNRLTRAEFADVLANGGQETRGMRGNHILSALAIRGVIVLGPVVPRESGPTRDQYVVATDDWIPEPASPEDPLAELLVRYLRGHGPAVLADFAWWAGLPKKLAAEAREGAGDRVREIEDGLLGLDEPSPRRSPVAPVAALPPFEEYYLSYADRSVPCAPEFMRAIGPSMNGIVRPVIVRDGEIVGVWSHSIAVGKHHLAPVPELFTDVPSEEVDAALARFSRFITG
jgi:hypothetical protein